MKLSLSKANIFTLIFILFVLGVCAQNNIGTPYIRNFSPKDFDAHSQNFAIIQDAKGRMFFGNFGLLEYNGNIWKEINTNLNSRIKSLAIDSTNKIFVGGYNDIGYLEYESDGKIKYSALTNKIDKQYLPFNNTNFLHTGVNGTFFTTKNNIFHYKNNKIKVVHSETEFTTANLINNKYFLYKGVEGGLYIYEKHLKLLPFSKHFNLHTHGIIFMLPFSKTEILLISEKKGAFVYNINIKNDASIDNNCDNKFLEDFKHGAEDYLRKYELTCAAKLKNNKLVLGTKFGGLVILNKKGSIEHVITKSQGLIDDYILAVYEDKWNNLWVCTNKGISHIEINSPITYFTKLSGIDNIVLNTIIHKETLYAGTINNGVFYLPKYKTQKEKYNRKFIPVQNNYKDYCFDIKSFNNDILLSASTKILSIYNNETIVNSKKLNLYSISTSKKHPKYIFAGLSDGFAYYEISYKSDYSDLKIDYRGRFKELDGYTIRHMDEDSLGNLWLSTDFHSIFKVKFTGENPINYDIIQYNTENGLPDVVRNICKISKNELYILNAFGIFKAYAENDSDFIASDSLIFQPVTEFEKSIKENKLEISRLFFDCANRPIVLTVDNRIILFEKQNSDYYECIDIPFKKIQKKIHSISLSENNILWAAGYEDGEIFRIDLNETKEYNQKFSTVIESVKLSNDSTIFFGYKNVNYPKYAKSELNNSHNKETTPNIIIDYKHNTVSFEYSCLFYESPKTNKYSYFLEGFDKKWSKWSLKSNKEYTNLPEGKYNFHVKAKNIFEVESTIDSYWFEINAPWYRAIFAYLVYLFLLFVFIILIVKIYTRKIKIDKNRLEKIVTERTSEIIKQKQQIEKKNENILSASQSIKLQYQEIQQQNEEIRAQSEEMYVINERLVELDHFKDGMMAMVVHDLKNPLNTILGLSDKPIVKQAGLQMLNMVLNILDIQKFEDTNVKLQLADANLLKLIEASMKNVELLIERKAINLQKIIPSDVILNIDTEIIGRVFVNLLTNAIKYTPNNGSIIISIEEINDPKFVKILVSDTGIGIPSNKLDKIFTKFSQIKAKNSGNVRSTGLGLAFCKMAIEAHNGSIGVEANTLNTQEKLCGTTFWFKLPFVKTFPNKSKNIPKGKTNDKPETSTIQLTAEDFDVLDPHLKLLKEFTVYEFSDINKIIKHIPNTKVEAICQWKKELDNALRSCNEKKYFALINIKKGDRLS